MALLVHCSYAEYDKQRRELMTTRIVAFMMAWHKRLGQDCEISYYVPKVVAREIIMKIYIKQCIRKKKRDVMTIGVELDDVNIACRRTFDTELHSYVYKNFTVSHPTIEVIGIDFLAVQSPWLIISDVVETMVSFMDNSELTNFMERVEPKMIDASKSCFFPRIEMNLWPKKNIFETYSASFFDYETGAHIDRRIALLKLKKETEVRVIYENVSFHWKIKQIQFKVWMRPLKK